MAIRYTPVRPTGAEARPRGPVVYRGGDALPFSIRFLETLGQARAHLRRRALAMGIAASLPLIGAAVYATLQAPVYQSTATVLIDPQAGRTGRADPSADAAATTGHLRLATSRTVLQKAIEQGKLAEDTALRANDGLLARAVRAGLGLAGFEGGGGRAGPASLIQPLSSAVQARPGEGIGLIEISGSSADATSSARIANAVAQAFVDEIVASADASLGSERSRQARRSEDLKARLQEAETKLTQFRARNGLDSSPARPAGETDAGSELARARLAASEARARYEQLQKLLAGGKEPEVIADLVRSPSVERLKAQYNDAAAQEISFRSSLGPRHPAYLEMQQQAREKKRLLQEGLRLALSAARIEAQTTREQEIAAEKRAGPEPAAAPVPQVQPTQLRELERDADIARAAYDRYLRALEAPDSGAPSVAARIVTPAAVPLASVSQGRGALFGGALALSALFAAFAAFRRGKAKSTPQVEQPRPMTARTVVAPSRTRPEAADRPVTPAVADPVAPVTAPMRPAADRPDQPMLAGIEALAQELAQASGEFALQTVLATAVSAGAAKSEATMALARAAQRLQMRVLVIDADDSEHSLSARQGAGAVAGTVPIQGRPRPLVIAEGGPQRLCFVPVEAYAPALPDLATLPALNGIAGNFDLVIIDGPALKGSLYERKLARAAQAVMLACPESAMPALNRVAMLLGVSAEVLRVVQPPSDTESVTDPAPRAGRPMGIVRLRKVA